MSIAISAAMGSTAQANAKTEYAERTPLGFTPKTFSDCSFITWMYLLSMDSLVILPVVDGKRDGKMGH